MEVLQNWLDATNMPFISAFLLGIMTAISPCPLATNITAIGFISKDIQNKKKIFVNGIIYTLGRGISYTALGIIIYFGASTFRVAKFFQLYGERILGPLLILIGIVMLGAISLKFPVLSKLTSGIENKSRTGSSWNALLLGIVFALAFCPYSGVLYFGMLIPMTVSSASGLFLPPVFALATGLPVIVIAWLLAYSISGIGGFYQRVKSFEIWFRRVVAVVFIGVGFYYLWIFYFRTWL